MKQQKQKPEVTLCVLKPDAYDRNIVNSIVSDIQAHGMVVTNFVQRRLTVEDVMVLYYESQNAPYFMQLLSYMTSGICVYFLVKCENAVDRLNELVGATDPTQAKMHTLRKKYGMNILKNTIHSSNSNRVNAEIEHLYNVKSVDDLICFPYYFRLKDGTICHTVSEHCYEAGKIIGIPKYFQTKTTVSESRIINGNNYVRNNSIEESILYSKLFTNIQVNHVKRFGEEICLFDVSEIDEIYNPFDKAKELYQYEGTETIFKDTKLIIDIIINELGINLEDIGIEGSILIGGYRTESDIDIVIKGIESVRKLQENFHLLKDNRFINLYDESDLRLIFSRRKKYASFDTLEEMLQQECNRTVGLINGRRFWMQPILGNNLLEMQENRRLYKIEYYHSNAEVIDAEKAFLWPSFYTIHDKHYGKVKVECYDPVYMNQVKKGEQVFLCAPMYIDLDTTERIIIFAPWIKENQVFKKIKL